MTLAALLRERGVRTALIVDDVYDEVPTASDLDPSNEAWATLNDDLTGPQRELVAAAYPTAEALRFDELVSDDGYVAALWRLRAELGPTVEPLFEAYVADQATDARFVRLARERLTALGLEVDAAGRDFAAAALRADVILIDLFFGKGQGADALQESKARLVAALEPRAQDPPIVVLMSRSPRLESKRDEFRDDVGLLDSAFRILAKADLDGTDRLELHLERLAENRPDSRNLARLFNALDVGLVKAAARTLKLLRKLRLSDVGQIQQLLLSAEGQPAGSYLVDVFDRVLQHEIEREMGIIDAALALNAFSAARHPPPYVAGSAELQDIVERLLTQNESRLRLPGSLGGRLAFGDVLRLRGREGGEDPAPVALLDDLSPTNVLLVLTPACDLQRGGAPRVLLLVGELRPLAVKDWTYGEDARTPAIRIDGTVCWAKWNLKHVDTVSHARLEGAVGRDEVRIVARLREEHALEIQQRVLAGMGRVGTMAALPGTFPVELDAFHAGVDGRPRRLPIAALAEGAVCFAGRDANGGQVLRLVLDETICDGVVEALLQVEEKDVAPSALTAFRHVRSTSDLRRQLTRGLDLKGVRPDDWHHMPSETGAAQGIQKMGLIAWNLADPERVLDKRHLNKAGVIFLIRDAERERVPGLGDAIRSGLVETVGRAGDERGDEAEASVPLRDGDPEAVEPRAPVDGVDAT